MSKKWAWSVQLKDLVSAQKHSGNWATCDYALDAMLLAEDAYREVIASRRERYPDDPNLPPAGEEFVGLRAVLAGGP